MRFHIPFTLSNPYVLKKRAYYFKRFVPYKKNSKLTEYLDNSRIKMTRQAYLSICVRANIISFFCLIFFFALVFSLLRFSLLRIILFSLASAFVLPVLVYFDQSAYPRIYSTRRERNIERNLLPALEDIYVQLSSGIPLFNIMSNIAFSDYGELSEEFRIIVRRINAGEQQEEVLEDVGRENSSLFFKRSLWQISNGLRAGSDLYKVIGNTIENLNEEQLIQIQNYGGRLNPLIVFYMLISVIIPSLSVAFIAILSSVAGASENMIKAMLIGVFVLVVLVQIMFMGLIKSKRPNLI